MKAFHVSFMNVNVMCLCLLSVFHDVSPLFLSLELFLEDFTLGVLIL